MASESLYERLGGDSVINVTVKLFYQKVLADPYINLFFKDVEMTRQMETQKSFLTKIYGGPHRYDGKTMREVHKPLVENMGLDDSHFDQLLSHLRSSLAEVGMDKGIIADAMAVAESYRDDVLNK